MRSTIARNLLLGCMLWIVISPVLADSPQTAQVLSKSKELVNQGAMDQAISLMELALEETPEADYPALVEQLRKCYVIAATQAKQSGRYEIADQYLHNLKVMDSASEPQAPATPEISDSSAPALKIPKAPLQRDDSDLNAPMTLASNPPVKRLPTIQKPSEESAENAPSAASNSKVQQFDLAEADTDFKAKKYTDACRIYQQLFDRNSLPESRRGHLAYCRSAALVERINKRPTDAGEWSEIQAELLAIQKIQPDFWFAEYLTDLVKERQNRQVAGSTNGKATAQLASNDGSAGVISRAASQIRSINPLRKTSTR